MRAKLESEGRGGWRAVLMLLAVVIAVGASLALVACGDDDSSDPTTTTEASGTPEENYAQGLVDATQAVAGLGGAVVSGDSDEETADQIRSETSNWESAIASITDLDLSGDLATQRDALVDASPAFVDAWNEVADEWEGSSTNGLLQLVQRREPILDGIDALATAISGAVSETGSAIQSELEDAESTLNDALSEITSASP